MKRFALALSFLLIPACTNVPVKKEEPAVVVPPKKTAPPAKPFLKHVQKEDKTAYDEVKNDQRILHLHSSEMAKATQKIDFWAALDPDEFNSQFSASFYTKDGNEYIHRVCSSASKDKVLLVDFFNYDVVEDDKGETYDTKSSKEKYQPLIIKNVAAIVAYCQDFKEILCSKKIKKPSKAKLMKDIKNPKLDEPTRTKSQNLWYELHFCSGVKNLKG
jgi:hypothetical protein